MEVDGRLWHFDHTSLEYLNKTTVLLLADPRFDPDIWLKESELAG
jgi:hypothetical protein